MPKPLLVRVKFKENVFSSCGDVECCGSIVDWWEVAVSDEHNSESGHGPTIRYAFNDVRRYLAE